MKSLLQHRWVRVVGWTVLAVLGLYLLAWLAVPPLLKTQVQRIGSDQLGRKLTIGAVHFNPWTLELQVDDLAVATADGAGEQVHVKRLYANAAAESVWRFAPVIDDVTVDGVAVKLTYLGDGHYDIDDVLHKLSKPSEPSSAKTPRFSLYNLSLADTSVDYIDRSVGRTQQLRDLSLAIPFISSFDSQREVKVAPRLAFTLNGSRFDSGALATPFTADRKTDATITLKGLDLAPYLAYLPAGLPLELQGAKIDADLKLGFEQTPRVAVKLSGTVNVRDLKVADAGGGELLSLSAVNAVLADVQPLAKIVRLTSIELVSPQVSLRKDAAGRLKVAMGGADAAVASASAATATAKRAPSAASDAAVAPTAAASQIQASASGSASASASASASGLPCWP
ncbi:MAG: hypothetical protein JWQ11_664 [Rhizobacter sp.]|nr:hypothetical protein [Rhizobacter sp.]